MYLPIINSSTVLESREKAAKNIFFPLFLKLTRRVQQKKGAEKREGLRSAVKKKEITILITGWLHIRSQ